MTLRRIVIIAFVVGLGVITWMRSPVPPHDASQKLLVERLDIAPTIEGEAEFENVWHLQSSNSDFGGYSALLLYENGRMFAGSDGGKVLRFDAPGIGSGSGTGADAGPGTGFPGTGFGTGQRNSTAAELGQFSNRDTDQKTLSDLESLARDPQTGRIWAGFEGINTIERVESDLSASVRVRPPQMQNWPSNSGPEAMARLEDGRFIVLSEGRSSWGDAKHAGLLFAGDPVGNDAAISFSFVPPDKYRPVDAVQIPDGRVLILVRNWSVGFPLKFGVRLMIADPAGIAQGGDWTGEQLARIDDPLIAENYEGLAFGQNPDGTLALWLISDDNRATYQRTLLLKLRWDPRPSLRKTNMAKEKARG